VDNVVVFDIGGTSFRVGYCNEEGELSCVTKSESHNFINNNSLKIEEIQNKLVDQIVDTANEYRKNNACINKIGVSFPGPVTRNGRIIKAPTLWGNIDKEFPLQEILVERLKDCEVYVINDITAAGWRYIDVQGGTFCLITVSSGIGNKIFWNREVLLNEKGLGGEMGHASCDNEYSQIPCDCGNFGHIASVSSGRGIECIAEHISNKYSKLYQSSCLKNTKFKTYEIINGIKNGDEFSKLLLRESIKPIANSISFIYSLIGIEKYIIIGGFASAVGKYYLDIVEELILEKLPMGLGCDDIKNMLMLGACDDNDGLIGMAKYIFNN